MPITPTAEQSAILSATTGSPASLMISAYAGTAKTTTIELLSEHLPPTNPTLALAFNVKIKEELERRLPKWVTVKTMNGLGHQAWGKALGKRLTLEAQKLGKLITQMGKDLKLDLSREAWNDTRLLVSAARAAGIVPSKFPQRGLTPDTEASWLELAEEHDVDANPQVLRFAQEVLVASCKQAFQGVIDFDDQIYMSVCFNGVFPRFHTVLVDEAQDLSLANHLMVQKVRPERLIVCGDPKQSLYAFRGAASDSMGKMRALAQDWIDLPLTLTFRCPREVVARQQTHAPGYRAADSNAQGTIQDLRGNPWSVRNLPISGSTAILCRNNAPLVKLAFKCLRQGHAIAMLGRDLGSGLVKTVEKLPGLHDGSPITEVLATLTAWFESERDKLLASGKDAKVEKISDRYESILAIAESPTVTNRENLISAIKTLFAKENGRLVFSSVHRAKGLEWDVVVHLDPWRIPSRFATSESALAQEDNIRYVAETRTKHTLVLADLEDFT